MKLILFFCCLLLFALDGCAQILFNKTYGGGSAGGIVEIRSGAYLAVGASKNQNGDDKEINVLRIDSVGNIIWSKYFGEDAFNNEWGYSITKVNSNYFLITGRYDNHTPFILRIDSDGNNVKWALSSGIFIAECFYTFLTPDQNWITLTNTQSGTELLKSDTNGVFFLNKSYSSLWGNAFIQTTDSGFAIIGSNDSNQIVLLKTSLNLDSVWLKKYGKPESGTGYCLSLCNDGGFILAGINNPDPYSYANPYLIRINSVGDTLWSTFNLSYSYSYQHPVYISETKDHGFIASIYYDYFDFWFHDQKVIIQKLDSVGTIKWYSTIEGYVYANGNNICQASDGGYLLFFTSLSGEYRLLKFDSLGNFVESTNDMLVNPTIRIFPNPSTDFVIFEFNTFSSSSTEIFIYNSAGELLKQFSSLHSSQLKIPVNQIGTDGMYFYTVKLDDDYFFAGKFVIQR